MKKALALLGAYVALYGCSTAEITKPEPVKAGPEKHHWVRMINSQGVTIAEWRLWDRTACYVNGQVWKLCPVTGSEFDTITVTVPRECAMIEEWR
jgi:hypothetical protein